MLHSLPAGRGWAVNIRHPDGAAEASKFPELASPHQPFFDIVGMS